MWRELGAQLERLDAPAVRLALRPVFPNARLDLLRLPDALSEAARAELP